MGFHYKGGLRIATLLCFFFLLDRPACADEVRPGYQVVSRTEIVEAMRQCGDYDPTVTTNGVRFQGEIILYLARKARARDPQGLPLFIGYEDWFRAFMEVTARTKDAMPQYAQLSYQYKQNTEVDYRIDRVIREISGSPNARTGSKCTNLVGGSTRQAGSVFVRGYACDAKIESNQSSGDDLSIGGFWKLGCV